MVVSADEGELTRSIADTPPPVTFHFSPSFSANSANVAFIFSIGAALAFLVSGEKLITSKEEPSSKLIKAFCDWYVESRVPYPPERLPRIKPLVSSVLVHPLFITTKSFAQLILFDSAGHMAAR